MTGTFKSWITAAAVLALEGDYLHYTVITHRVMKSGMTELGKEGVTPAQTIGAEMRRKHDVFESLGGGDYRLRGDFSPEEDTWVLMAIMRLEQLNGRAQEAAGGGA